MSRWMHSDEPTNRAKEASYRKIYGRLPPQRAWYYSQGYNGGLDDTFLEALRSVFWNPATKERVTRSIDVKVESVPDLPGVPILRVSGPERLVVSFKIGEVTFVLYRASRMEFPGVLDFARNWDRLSDASREAHNPTVVAGLGADPLDAPPPLAMLREAERTAPEIPPPPMLPPPDARRQAPRFRPDVAPRGTIIPESLPSPTPIAPAELPADYVLPSVAAKAPVAPVAAMAPPPIMLRGMQGGTSPTDDPWKTFGVAPSAPPEDATRPSTQVVRADVRRPPARPAFSSARRIVRKPKSHALGLAVVGIILLLITALIVFYTIYPAH